MELHNSKGDHSSSDHLITTEEPEKVQGEEVEETEEVVEEDTATEEREMMEMVMMIEDTEVEVDIVVVVVIEVIETEVIDSTGSEIGIGIRDSQTEIPMIRRDLDRSSLVRLLEELEVWTRQSSSRSSIQQTQSLSRQHSCRSNSVETLSLQLKLKKKRQPSLKALQMRDPESSEAEEEQEVVSLLLLV